MKHIHYPKLTLLCLSFVLAYLLYHGGMLDILPEVFQGYGYVSMFIAGLLFSFGFTTAFAIAIFLEMSGTVHPVPGALIAGIGALAADMTIFEFIRFSFLDELHRLNKNAVVRWIGDKIHHKSISQRMRQYLLWSMGGLIIASPLPDEIGVSFIGGMTEIKDKQFAVICYAFNTVGILFILIVARAAA